MAWTIKRDPQLPAVPVFHDPERCMNCGHLATEHDSDDPDVGCLVEGGTKYIEDENGVGKRVCACVGYVTSPEKVEMIAVAEAAALRAAPSGGARL